MTSVHRILTLPVVFVLLACSKPQTRSAGYDPNADPFADLASAVLEAQHTHKRILLEVGGEWCSWCHRLEEFIQSNEEIREALRRNFVVVKVNYSKENKNEAFLSQYPAIEGYPHIFVLDSDGTLLHSQDTGELEAGKGYDPEKLLQFIRTWGTAT